MTARLLYLTLCIMMSASAAGAARTAVVLRAPALDRVAAYAAEDALFAEVERRLETPLLPHEATRALVESARGGGLDCTLDDFSCLEQLAQLLGVERLLIVLYLPPQVEGSLFDLKSGEVRAKASLDAPAGFSERTAQRVASLLLAPESTGTLLLSVAPEEARVHVDGEQVLETRVVGLEAGEHEVTATLEGFAPFSTRVAVEAGRTLPVEVRLVPPTPSSGPAMSTWLMGGGAAGALAGVVVAAGGLGGAYLASSAATTALAPTSSAAERSAAQDAARNWGGFGGGALALGSGLVVAGVAVALAGPVMFEGE